MLPVCYLSGFRGTSRKRNAAECSRCGSYQRPTQSSSDDESVGPYEGDTLLIDTVSFNTKSFVDRYGTPYSDHLHLVERYRMSADGKNLIADVTYDDPKAYTTKWSAVSKYHRGRVMPDEVACAESQVDPSRASRTLSQWRINRISDNALPSRQARKWRNDKGQSFNTRIGSLSRRCFPKSVPPRPAWKPHSCPCSRSP
jgi:hypothetical protein